MPISFAVHDGQGVFSYPKEPFWDLDEQLDELIHAKNTGQMSLNAYLKVLQALVAQEPEWIDGHAHIGNTYYEKGQPKKALEACLKGVEIGQRLVPSGYQGPVEWGHLENRPFLRAMNGVVLSYVYLHRHKDAIAAIQQLLAYDPDDNLGVRFFLGSEQLRVGQKEQAKVTLKEESVYPPCRYDLALLYLEDADYLRAATELRKAFLLNPYIVEELLGNPEPRRTLRTNSALFADRETADHYVHTYSGRWNYLYSYLNFLHWVYNHSVTLRDRAAYQAILEAMLQESDGNRRVALLHQSEEILMNITDKSSQPIVQKVTTARGREGHPWHILEDDRGIL
ncbi:hypothetical protein MQE22_08610 [Acidithiobacillus sp. YTS05]|nr:hypothetical protein MQE22_08610 [Acidithiobacillus sp. YTS05]